MFSVLSVVKSQSSRFSLPSLIALSGRGKTRQITWGGDLRVGGGGGDQLGFHADGFEGGGFVGDGELVFQDVLVGGAYQGCAEDLGGLDEPEVLAGDGGGGEIRDVGAF